MEFLNWLKSLPWKRIGLISLCVVLALILITSIFVTAYVEHLLGQIIIVPGGTGDTRPLATTEFSKPTLPPDATGETVDPTVITLPPEPELYVEHEDIINIMLVGQDRRPDEHYLTRSDAMILCTFNTKDRTITMTSFMRDMYVEIPGKEPYKMNQAYAWGGMELLRKTMEKNFAVKVDAFVEVDFNGFQKVVEILGGVDITLTQAEADHLNSEYGWNLAAGSQHLNGEQTLAYSRIRYVGGTGDFGRTERQRNVLSSILNSCKSMSLNQAVTLLNEILPLIATDMTKDQIFDYAFELFPMLTNSSMTTQRIPIDGSYELKIVKGLDVVLPDLEINRKYLYDTLMPQ